MDLSSSVAFRSAKERQTNATFAERKATMCSIPIGLSHDLLQATVATTQNPIRLRSVLKIGKRKRLAAALC